jgi:hypothetical protein
MGLLAFIPVLDKILDKAFPDPIQRAQVQKEMAEIADREAAREAANQLQQIEVNKVEATHRSIFVAGWRPAIGWVGALSLFMYYPVQIATQLILEGKTNLDIVDLLGIIAGLLGFGGMRSFDKIKGVSDDAPLGKTVVTPVAQSAQKKGKILPDWLR